MKKLAEKPNVNNFEFSNDENKAVAQWLTKTVNGNKVLATVKNADELETEVRKFIANKGSIKGIEVGNEDEGLEWVAFGDLFAELKTLKLVK